MDTKALAIQILGDVNARLGLDIDVAEFEKFVLIVQQKIFGQLPPSAKPILYVLAIARKKYIIPEQRQQLKFKAEEKIGRSFSIVQNSDILDYEFAYNIWRVFNTLPFEDGCFLKPNTDGNIKRIPISTVGVYWNPNLIDLVDLWLGLFKETTDVINRILEGDLEGIKNPEGVIKTLAHKTRRAFSKNYPRLALIDIDLKYKGEPPPSLVVEEEELFQSDLFFYTGLTPADVAYVMKTSKRGYHILVNLPTDKNLRREFSKYLTNGFEEDLKGRLLDYWIKSAGVNVEVEIKFSDFLTPVGGIPKAGFIPKILV